MNPLERGLSQDIPFADAADFFIKLKYGSAENLEKRKLAEMQAKLKQAAGMGAIGAAPPPPALPPGGMGQNMTAATPGPLPASGQGSNMPKMGAVNHDKEIGEERGRRSLSMKFEKDKHTKGERIGSTLGSVAGALGGAGLGKTPVTRAAGALVGYGVGSKGGREIGKLVDQSSYKKKKAHAMFKQALGEMFGEGSQGQGSIAPHVDMSQYMAMEEQGESAEQSNQAEFLRNKLQQAHAELQQAQDQASMANQQAQQLQAQQSQHEQQLQAAQQQSQLATQAAMQNVDHAHQLAMQATSQTLQAKDDAINTHQLAAQMRMAYQDLRGNIMDSVAQDAAAPVGEAIKAQGALAAQPAAPPGGDPNAVPGAENTDPNMAPAQEGPAGEAAPAAAGPTAAPAEGGEGPPNQANGDGSGGEGASATAAPANNMQDVPQPGVGGSPKQASLTVKEAGAVMNSAMNFMKERAPHAAVGAALGAGAMGIESQLNHQGLRDKVQRLEGSTGGFGRALQLAAAKAQLTIAEGAEQHPIGASVAGGIAGAAYGMSLGPGLSEGFGALGGRLKELRGGRRGGGN